VQNNVHPWTEFLCFLIADIIEQPFAYLFFTKAQQSKQVDHGGEDTQNSIFWSELAEKSNPIMVSQHSFWIKHTIIVLGENQDQRIHL
jgi:hypothetical protein